MSSQNNWWPAKSYIHQCHQDKLLISLLLGLLFKDIISLVVGCSSFKNVKVTLALTHILKLHMDLRKPQGDMILTDYLQRWKIISDEFVAIGQPIQRTKFNIYIFKGPRLEFCGMVAALAPFDEPPFFSKIHSSFLNQVVGYISSSAIAPVVNIA